MNMLRASVLLLAISTAPLHAATVLEFTGNLGYEFEGPESGFQQLVKIEVFGETVTGDPSAVWDRIALDLFRTEDGKIGSNTRFDTAYCTPFECVSTPRSTTMIGKNVYSFFLRSERGYNDCTPETRPYVFCGVSTTYDRGRVYLTADGVTSDKPTTFRITFGDATAIPEPSTWALMLGGFGFLGMSARRRDRLACTTG